MNILKNLFGLNGLSINKPSWEVEPPIDKEKFFSGLNILLPRESTLYFEGVYNEEMKNFLKRHSIKEINSIARGTVLPKLNYFHVPFSDELLSELAALAGKVEDGVCTHFHAYHGGGITLYWHDAFQNSILLSEDVSEDKLKKFCSYLGVNYKRFSKI